MSDVPPRSAYTPESRRRVIHAATTLARTLGDLVERSVVVGGLVPTALEELRVLDDVDEPHVGTLDLDLALAIAVRNTEDATEIRRRALAGRFSPAARGNRDGIWRWESETDPGVLLEFLVDSDEARIPAGRIASMGTDIAALAARGIRLAFARPHRRELQAASGDAPSLAVRVCALAPFIVLKAFAVDGREPRKPKDAYDLDHVLRNCTSRAGLADELVALPDPITVRDAMEKLEMHFSRDAARGPRGLEAFLGTGNDPARRADCVGFALELLREWRARSR